MNYKRKYCIGIEHKENIFSVNSQNVNKKLYDPWLQNIVFINVYQDK